MAIGERIRFFRNLTSMTQKYLGILVIADHEMMIISSHNWLSNKGASTQAKQETSCTIHEKEAINYVIERFFEKSDLIFAESIAVIF